MKLATFRSSSTTRIRMMFDGLPVASRSIALSVTSYQSVIRRPASRGGVVAALHGARRKRRGQWSGGRPSRARRRNAVGNEEEPASPPLVAPVDRPGKRLAQVGEHELHPRAPVLALVGRDAEGEHPGEV